MEVFVDPQDLAADGRTATLIASVGRGSGSRPPSRPDDRDFLHFGVALAADPSIPGRVLLGATDGCASQLPSDVSSLEVDGPGWLMLRWDFRSRDGRLHSTIEILDESGATVGKLDHDLGTAWTPRVEVLSGASYLQLCTTGGALAFDRSVRRDRGRLEEWSPLRVRVAGLESLRFGFEGRSASKGLDTLVAQIDRSMDPAIWARSEYFRAETEVISTLAAAARQTGLEEFQLDAIFASMAYLLMSDRGLVLAALDDALGVIRESKCAATPNPRACAKVQEDLADTRKRVVAADAALGEGQAVRTVREFREAWESAQRALAARPALTQDVETTLSDLEAEYVRLCSGETTEQCRKAEGAFRKAYKKLEAVGDRSDPSTDEEMRIRIHLHKLQEVLAEVERAQGSG